MGRKIQDAAHKLLKEQAAVNGILNQGLDESK